MTVEQFLHQTVLLHEAVNALQLKPNGIYIDGTFGRGGHSRLILTQLGEAGRLIAMDRDPQAIEEAKRINDPRFIIIHAAFSELADHISSMGLLGKIDGVLLDLGISSPQIDDPSRGFSFMRDGPLDMRMDPTKGLPAAQWLQQASVEEIAWVLKQFGEERFANRIAQSIKKQQPITTTRQLAEVIANATPIKDRHKHPATRSFQAIRIYVNSELEEIEQVLQASLSVLAPQGRLSVISFHSLEDRIVKQFIRKQSQKPSVPAGLPLTEQQINQLGQPQLQSLGKLIPSEQEIEANPRARSAVLRIAEKRTSV